MSGSRAAKVLVIGSGGREHALAWKLAQSDRVGQVIVAPGNDGMPAEWERWPARLGGNASDARPEFERLAKRCRDEGVDLAVIGPDDPLAAGIVDVFEAAGQLTFGPRQAAARMEWSKAFAKEVMIAAGVPTARYVRVGSAAEGIDFLKKTEWGQGWVVKADRLALGKGVVVCSTQAEAIAAVESLIAVSGSLVIEERLSGEELSWMAFCDGKRCALLEPARDYKRLKDGDEGPNTGGMGAISPVPGIPAHFEERVRREIFEPVLAELAKRGTPFAGLLYAGLMVDVARDQIWVIEFNSRFGDPETQVLVPRIEGDLYRWCEASARGDLSRLPGKVPFEREAAVVVVGAAAGYPAQPEKGVEIPGLMWPARDGAIVFWAGVARAPGQSPEGSPRLVTNGGRVFGSMGRGVTLEQARARAFAQLKSHAFQAMQYRRDIGFFPGPGEAVSAVDPKLGAVRGGAK